MLKKHTHCIIFIFILVSQQGQATSVGPLVRGRSSSFSMPDPSSTLTEPTTESTTVNLRYDFGNFHEQCYSL